MVAFSITCAVQDARFQELVATYQNTVLAAQQDVENGLITFIRAQTRTKLQNQCVIDAEKAVKIALAQYTAGVIDLTHVTLLQQTLVQQQDTLARRRGKLAWGWCRSTKHWAVVGRSDSPVVRSVRCLRQDLQTPSRHPRPRRRLRPALTRARHQRLSSRHCQTLTRLRRPAQPRQILEARSLRMGRIA